MAETEPDKISEHTQITDHASRAVQLLPRQFRTKAGITALLQSWIRQAQEIEDALWALLQCTLDTAVGDALDQIGALLAFARGSMNDDDYRVMLRAIVRARQSSGTGEDLLEVIGLMFDPDGITFSTLDGYASWLVVPHAVLPYSSVSVLRVLQIAKAGGVQLQLIDPPRAESSLFGFSANTFFSETSTTEGFSDVAATTGGYLTGVID